MAAIKSFTSLEQSKVLAKILPLKSADAIYIKMFLGRTLGNEPMYHFEIDLRSPEQVIWDSSKAIPCWSLMALLEQLKSEIILENKQILFLHLNKYDDNSYEIRYTNSWTGEVLIAEADNLVDACVDMIEKLHELNLL